MIKDIKKSKDPIMRAWRLGEELLKQIDYYLTNWADCLAQDRARQAGVFKIHLDKEIELARDFRMALWKLGKPKTKTGR